MTRRTLTSALPVVLLLAGCRGDVLLGDMPADGGGEAGDAAPADAAPVDAAVSCSTPPGPRYKFTSVADVKSSLAGRWQLCLGRINSPSDAQGIEFADSNAWVLVRDAGGNLVRGAGFDYQLGFEVIDTSVMNGPNSYQVNLSTGGGFNTYTLDYSVSPRIMRMNEGTSGNQATYAATN